MINTNKRLAMSRFILSVLLCSVAQSFAIVPHGLEDAFTESSPDTPAQCAHNADTEYAVISWPNDSCAADLPNFSTLSTPTPYPLSCPATSLNTKCFPITEDPSYWEDIVSPSVLDSETDQQVRIELRRARKRDTIPNSTPSAYNAKSVTLKWPDRMRHAVFYTDDRCQVTDTESGEIVGWHVEREGLRGDDCVGVEQQGSWGSVEFMREDEWAVWDRRRRGVDDGVGSGTWGWRGLL